MKRKFHTTKQFKAKERRVEMKRLAFIVAAFAVIGAVSAWAGDSPGTPGPTRYTLMDIYDYLNSGTTATIAGHTLEPPSGALPGDTRFKTLNDIYTDTKTKFDLCDATAADVKAGKKFFSTVSGSWGVKTGTAVGGLLKTGQTASYQTGDDGTYSSSKGTAFSLSIGNNSTVNDAVTGLQWQAGTEPGTKTWSTAITWAEGLVMDGKDDWRLPNITELQTLFVRNAGQTAPYIDKTMFPLTVSDYYWSSTASPVDTDLALLATFNSGLVHYGTKTNSSYVRAVRGGD